MKPFPLVYLTLTALVPLIMATPMRIFPRMASIDIGPKDVKLGQIIMLPVASIEEDCRLQTTKQDRLRRKGNSHPAIVTSISNAGIVTSISNAGIEVIYISKGAKEWASKKEKRAGAQRAMLLDVFPNYFNFMTQQEKKDQPILLYPHCSINKDSIIKRVEGDLMIFPEEEFAAAQLRFQAAKSAYDIAQAAAPQHSGSPGSASASTTTANDGNTASGGSRGRSTSRGRGGQGQGQGRGRGESRGRGRGRSRGRGRGTSRGNTAAGNHASGNASAGNS